MLSNEILGVCKCFGGLINIELMSLTVQDSPPNFGAKSGVLKAVVCKVCKRFLFEHGVVNFL